MSIEITKAARFLRGAAGRSILAALVIFGTVTAAQAATQIWTGGTTLFNDTATAGSPAFDDWANSANWSLAVVPNTAADTAIFGNSGNNNISFSQDITVGTIDFNGNPVSNDFLLTNNTTVNPTGHTVTLAGTGIVDASGHTQTFELRAFSTAAPVNTLQFTNSATAADLHVLLSGTANSTSAQLEFRNSSSAGTSIITLNTGELDFHDTATGANATITLKKGSTANFFDSSTAGAAGILDQGTATFHNNATAGGANITVSTLSTASSLTFLDSSNAGNATITTSGLGVTKPIFSTVGGISTVTFSPSAGLTQFAGNANAANAIFITSSTGAVDFIGNSTAGNAIFTTNSNGVVVLDGSSTASTATFNTNSGGRVVFLNGASGGEAVLNTSSGGLVDFSRLTSGNSTTVGAMNGTGVYSFGFGSNPTITVGGSNLDSNLGGTLQGAGTLIKAGTGTLNFSGSASSFSGSYVVNGGTFELSGGGSISIASTITDNSSLAFDLAASSSFGNQVSGTGQLVQLGTGTTLQITTADSYTGGTLISAGTLQVGDGATLGSIVGNVVDNSDFQINHGDNYVFGGAISGSGSFEMVGTGTTELSGANTYTGGTTVRSGTLQLGDAISMGSLAGAITVNTGSSLDVENEDLGNVTSIRVANGSATFHNATSASSAAITLDGTVGPSTLTFFNNSTAGSANIHATSSTVTFNDASTAGTSTIVLDNGVGGTTTPSLTFNGASGAGTANIHSTDAQITFNGTSTAGTSTIVLDSAAGGGVNFPNLSFNGTATAGQANITATDETILFNGQSDAGSAIINQSNPNFGGFVDFNDTTSAKSSQINLSNNGFLEFLNNSTADHATLTASGLGFIDFNVSSTAANATVNLDGSILEFDATATAANAVVTGTNSEVLFTGSATAGNASFTIQGSGLFFGGPNVDFQGTSNAGMAMINIGATELLAFDNSSSAAQSVITVAGAGGLPAGEVAFNNTSNAGQSSITLNTGALALFSKTSDAGSASIAASDGSFVVFTGDDTVSGATADTATISLKSGGRLVFLNGASGGQATVTAGTGTMIDISGLLNGGTTLGSINGAGNVFLGGNTLTLGVDNSDSEIGGTVADGGIGGGAGGSLAKVGTGTLTLDGTYSYTGTTTIGAGTLVLGGATNTLTGAIVDNSALATQGTLLTLAGNIGGSGSLTVTGGTTVLGGANSFSGGTTVTGGTLQIGNGGTSGSIVGDVVDNGTLVFDRSDVVVFGGTISGTGAVVTVSGTTELLNPTYSGTTTISQGSLAINGGTVSLVGDIIDNGALIGLATSLTLSGNVSGGGSLVIDDGTTTLLGSDTYTGGTTINSGQLQIGDGGTIGSIVGDVTDNGTLAFDRSDNVVFSGTISGTGGLGKLGAGTLALTGAYSYTGVTTVGAFIIRLTSTIGQVAPLGTSTLVLGGGTNTLTGDILDNGALITQATSLTLSGNISGSGSLSVTGGTTILTGINSYTGGTTVTGGTLSISADANLGLGTVALEDGSTLQTTASFNLAHAITIAGNTTFDVENGVVAFVTAPITDGAGPGTLVKIGDGPLDLAAANTYSGGTFINAGALFLGAGGLAGSVVGTISVTNAALVVVDSDFSQVSSVALNNGVAVFVQSSAGAAITGANNSIVQYSGTATAGTSQLAMSTGSEVTFMDTTSAGNATISATNRGFVSFTGTATAGQAQISLDGGSVADFDTSSSGGSAKISATNRSTIQFLGSADAGQAQLLAPSFAAVAFANASNADLAQVALGNQSALEFFNTASGGLAAVIMGGGSFLNIANLTNGGTTLGSVNGGGTVVLGANTLTIGGDNSDSVMSSAIAGTGGITKVGTGVLDLTGLLLYSGATTISAGTVKISSNAIFRSNIVDNALLVTDSSGLTLAGDVSGNGEFDVVSGSTFLTGANDFSGRVVLSGGVLDVNGTLANASITQTGGTLKGNGTVGTVTLGAGSAVAPGNSIGTLHVAGNVVFGGGSTYQVEADSLGNSDLIDATGAVTIAPGAQMAVSAAPGGYHAQTSYVVISATGGVTGTFDTPTVDLSFLTPQLVYSATQVNLVLTIQDINFAALTTTPNEAAAAAAVKDGGPNSAIYSAMLEQTPNTTFVPHALDQLSGEIHPSVLSAEIEDSHVVRQTLLDRLRQTTNGDAAGVAIAPVHPAEMHMLADHLAMWVSLIDDWGHNASDGNVADLTHALDGVLAGVDGDIGNDLTVGVAGGYTHSHLNERASAATGGNGHIAGYGGWKDGALAVRLAAAYDWGNDRVARFVNYTGFSDSLSDRQDGHTTQVFGEAGYAASLGPVAAEPFAGLAFVDAGTGAFLENGGASALSSAGSSLSESYSSLGIRLAPPSEDGVSLNVTPHASISWEHMFSRLTPAEIVTFEATGQAFRTLGMTIDRDAANIQIGLDVRVAPAGMLTFSYEGVQSSRLRDNSLRAELSWNF